MSRLNPPRYYAVPIRRRSGFLVMHRYLFAVRSFFHHVALYFKGVKVFALVGKAGTGKSFRAQLIAEKLGIDILLDDGLLIRDQRILAGKSAKKETRTYSAVKVALFSEPEQAREVKKALSREDFKKILILGTSDKMIRIITNRLDLPHASRIIRIEDIATEVEIEAATHARSVNGQHIIPVPAIEVKQDYSHIFLNSIWVFFKRRFALKKEGKWFEKTVVRPAYSYKGKVTISEAALSQMVLHCVNEYNPAIKIAKIIMAKEKWGYKLEVILEVPFEMEMAGKLHALQHYIANSIERFAGLDLQEVNVTVGKVSRQKKKKEKVAEEQTQISFPEED